MAKKSEVQKLIDDIDDEIADYRNKISNCCAMRERLEEHEKQRKADRGRTDT